MNTQHALVLYLFGFVGGFAALMAVVFLASALIGSESVPMWLMATVVPIAILAASSLLTVLFLKKTAQLSRDVTHDGSRIDLSQFAQPQQQFKTA